MCRPRTGRRWKMTRCRPRTSHRSTKTTCRPKTRWRRRTNRQTTTSRRKRCLHSRCLHSRCRPPKKTYPPPSFHRPDPRPVRPHRQGWVIRGHRPAREAAMPSRLSRRPLPVRARRRRARPRRRQRTQRGSHRPPPHTASSRSTRRAWATHEQEPRTPARSAVPSQNAGDRTPRAGCSHVTRGACPTSRLAAGVRDPRRDLAELLRNRATLYYRCALPHTQARARPRQRCRRAPVRRSASARGA
jgi:hypothetical protein